MNSVLSVAVSRLPALPLLAVGPAARRRLLVLVAFVVLAALAAAALIATQALPFWQRPAARSAHAAEIAAARSQAIAIAKQRALTAGTLAARPPASLPAPLAASRVVAPAHAADLFATHSWYVAPPPPPPPAPVAPPPPTAPPFPYTYVGSFTPAGEPPVFFIAHGDRVLDVRVGDDVDGVYAFETADVGQLVFNYLPLNVRQTVPTGANQ